VRGADGLGAALARARRVAESAFGDARLMIERYLPAPRHVEVQVLCDAHGNQLHLHTRDCSLQRRHQKLIEEAPAPGIAEPVRERLHAAGLAVARAVGYVNAGTIEFLYADGEFFFMEMNTRLQVEHCVTEEVLGLDLVEWQLRIAAGEPLTLAQSDIVPRGHAIEARVCAEDAASGFVPSAGRLTHLAWPEHVAHVRVDAGFEQGDEVPSQYDSLLGKVIGTGADRAAALGALARGLAALRVVGVATNAAWLARALEVPAFANAALSTGFAAEHAATLVPRATPTSDEIAAAALAIVGLADAPAGARPSPWSARDAFRLNLPAAQSWLLRSGDADCPVEVVREGAQWRVRSDGSDALYGAEFGADSLTLTTALGRRRVDVVREGDRLALWRGAERLDVAIIDPRHVEELETGAAGELTARLPGTVVAVPVKVGEQVAAGATLMVLEAMKMEHAVLAPRAGVVTRLHFAKGDRVPEGATLVDLGDPPAAAAPAS